MKLYKVIALSIIALTSALPTSASDVTQVPLWDGETLDPSGPLLNRFGGNPVNGIHATVSHTTEIVRSGNAAFRIDTNQTIPMNGFDFVGISLTGFYCPMPVSPCPVKYIDIRDVTPFDAVNFWIRNETGSPFSLVFEIKDYRDSNSHRVRRSFFVPAASVWAQVHVPLDLADPGWVVIGTPDLTQAKVFALVIEANQGTSVAGSIYLDDMVVVEPAGPIDSDTAPIDTLLERLTRRQFNGLWGARDRATGMMPSISSFADVCAMNVLAAMVHLLPQAIAQSWVTRSEADSYLSTVVTTLDTIMDSALYVPPRYVDRLTLQATYVREESSVDAAFLFLALYRYKGEPGIDPALEASIDLLLDRFNFAAFSSLAGWRLAYVYDLADFTAETYNGYSGEPWLISLAAHLATVNRVDITTHWSSAILRAWAYLEDPDRAHLVHPDSGFRAPFLQWLLHLFVDVSDRGIDSFPDIALADNPYANAVRYQLEAHARMESLGRATFLQPDAGDDGTGGTYEQFSCYNDFGQPDLFMPWSSSFSFLADPVAGEAALRDILGHGLHGPLGLTDSVKWQTGQPGPSLVPARHDLWNVGLSTMALVEYLYDDHQFLTSLPEVAAALDAVYPLFRDGFESGDVLAWSTAVSP